MPACAKECGGQKTHRWALACVAAPLRTGRRAGLQGAGQAGWQARSGAGRQACKERDRPAGRQASRPSGTACMQVNVMLTCSQQRCRCRAGSAPQACERGRCQPSPRMHPVPAAVSGSSLLGWPPAKAPLELHRQHCCHQGATCCCWAGRARLSRNRNLLPLPAAAELQATHTVFQVLTRRSSLSAVGSILRWLERGLTIATLVVCRMIVVDGRRGRTGCHERHGRSQEGQISVARAMQHLPTASLR